MSDTRELEDRIEQLDEIENDVDRVAEFLADAANRFEDINGYNLEDSYGAYNAAEIALEEATDAIADLLIEVHSEQGSAQDDLDEAEAGTDNEEDDEND